VFGRNAPQVKTSAQAQPPLPTAEELIAKALEEDILRSVRDLADASIELSMARREEQADRKRKEAAAIRARIQASKGP
jgi:hypothetical protein